MQDQNGQYKPLNKNVDLNDLVCPKCGNDVPAEQYNEVTQLIKCGECDNIFAYLGNGGEAVKEPTEYKVIASTIENQNSNSNRAPSFLLVSLLLIAVLVLIWYLKVRTS